MGPGGFEPPTYRLRADCSTRLSHEPMERKEKWLLYKSFSKIENAKARTFNVLSHFLKFPIAQFATISGNVRRH